MPDKVLPIRLRCRHLQSLGHLAATAAVPLATVQAALDDIGAEPVFSLNGVHFFEPDVCATVLQRLKERS